MALEIERKFIINNPLFLKNYAYDIAFIDIKMPILSGEDVIKSVRSKKLNDTTYFVAITAYYLQNEREKYLQMGFDDYLTKPLNIESLVTCIDKMHSTRIYPTL